MAWLLLLAAAALEVVWAVALKQGGRAAALGLAVAGLSLALLALALRDLPVSIAYAVWTGLGSAGVAVVGMAVLGEPASAPRVLCLALVLAGVVGLRAAEG